jgi:flagellar hook-length control protein FliK
VQAVRLQWRDGVGDARLTLQPDYLGDVTISLRVEQGGVTAHVNAESADVRAWMSANEPSLRQGLAEHGLTLDRLIVSEEPADATPDRDGRRQRAPQEEQQQPRKAPPRRPETATFEVVV